ncbi:MAG: F0F1 ATP synthase subunit gamma [Magnetococcales bacterium]|nr:F0F1 ATP synthase subunit gamma [Magnetococcales bacterium]
MPNLKDLKNRIRSVENTQQITKAMKMVAAAKLRRSQERAETARPYSEKMTEMSASLARGMSDAEGGHPLISGHTENPKKIEIVLFTADRGLCGSFNSGVIRAVRAKIEALQANGKKVSLTCVGTKGDEVLRRQFEPLIRNRLAGMTRELSFENVEKELALQLVHDYDEGVFDECYIVYNKFKSAMTQILTWRRLMPVEVGEEQEEVGGGASHLFEPEEDELLADLLPKSVAVQLYQALVESDASEHGSRMTAMDNAVRNAADMIQKLTITYNRTRQAVITTELMEIIGGAESLKG